MTSCGGLVLPVEGAGQAQSPAGHIVPPMYHAEDATTCSQPGTRPEPPSAAAGNLPSVRPERETS